MQRSTHTSPIPRQPLNRMASACLATLCLAGGAVHAQTSGTLTPMQTSYGYATAPWVITAGAGAYPDGGGVLSLGPVTAVTPGTLLAVSSLNINVSPTLSQINFNSPISTNLTTGAGQSIVAAATGLTLNGLGTPRNVVVDGYNFAVQFGSQISSPISGGGTAGLTRTGPGNLYLLGANTYTGGTHFNGGFTSIGGSAAVGDAVFGASGAGNGLTFNGGSVFFNTAGGLTTDREVFIDQGGAALVLNTSTTLNGVVSGSGRLTQMANSSSTLTYTAANTFTGDLALRGPNAYSSAVPAMTLSSNGSFASASALDLQGMLTLDNTGSPAGNRLNDVAPITMGGATFFSRGHATTTSAETVGAVTVRSGFNTLMVSPGAAAGNSLTLAGFTRDNRSTVIFRGANLGAAPGAGAANIYLPAAPNLVGGGGAAGSQNISIIPYAIGYAGPNTTLVPAGLVGSSFVTYGSDGVRPLSTLEYAFNFGINSTDNVRVSLPTVAPTATVNALLVAADAESTIASPFLSGGTITVSSGAFMYSATTDKAGVVSNNLNFGSAEGVVSNTSTLTLNGTLSGTAGLTLSSAYAAVNNYTPSLSLLGANTYSGDTTIKSGAIGFSGTVAEGVAGAFGTSGSVILNGGVNLAGLVTLASTSFERDIRVIGPGKNFISQATSSVSGTSPFTSTFNGAIELVGNLVVEGRTNVAANAMVFNGTISGPGAIQDLGFTHGVFNGDNTYAGGTLLLTSSYYAGSDTAFGTGPISFTNTATLAGAGTEARTLANPLLLSAPGTFGGTAPLTLTGDVSLNGTRAITVSNTALTTFTGAVNDGSLTKLGNGAVAFNSPTGNNFAGGFVNTGTSATASAIYANNSSGSAFGAGSVSIGASGSLFSTLAGHFTVAGATRIAGRLSPGNGEGLTAATAGLGSIGRANFDSTLSFSSAATSSLYLEIASAASFDQVNVGGLLSLDGTVYIATLDGYTIQAGDSFDFMNFGSIEAGSIVFDLAQATLAPGVFLDTSMFTTTGTVTAVPEPGTRALFGAAALLALAGRLARRRRVSAPCASA
jgi:fibronectin-binding autotransporter adhesin